MDIKIINNDEHYRHVVLEAERLVSLDPSIGTPEADRLELLTLLIEDYEKRNHSFDTPDPISAIEHRMIELGLKQKDLVGIIGSKSRVSELLSGKRPLTLPMIRSLANSLSIPLEALIKDSTSFNQDKTTHNDSTLDWSKFPLKAMIQRGWISVKDKNDAEIAVKDFFTKIGLERSELALFRRTFKGEKLDHKSYYSTLAWSARVLMRGKEVVTVKKFTPNNISEEFLRDLARQSWYSDGPRKAIKLLEDRGIVVVVEPKLPNTMIDGAAMLSDEGVPIIGLTLRYDRVDYFWFTLLHEVAHVWQHLTSSNVAYIDRVDNMSNDDNIEKEANRIAREALIPRPVWRNSDVLDYPTRENIVKLAEQLHIHAAVVAGRLHYETGRFEIFRDLLEQGSVRQCFPNAVF